MGQWIKNEFGFIDNSVKSHAYDRSKLVMDMKKRAIISGLKFNTVVSAVSQNNFK